MVPTRVDRRYKLQGLHKRAFMQQQRGIMLGLQQQQHEHSQTYQQELGTMDTVSLSQSGPQPFAPGWLAGRATNSKLNFAADACIQSKVSVLVVQVCYLTVQMLVITKFWVVISHIINVLSCCLSLHSKIA